MKFLSHHEAAAVGTWLMKPEFREQVRTCFTLRDRVTLPALNLPLPFLSLSVSAPGGGGEGTSSLAKCTQVRRAG